MAPQAGPGYLKCFIAQPLTTTNGDSPAMTYVECLQHVEEELFLVRREHAGKLKELANVCEHVGSLTVIVEELRRLVATNLGVSQEMQDTLSNSPGTPSHSLGTPSDQHLLDHAPSLSAPPCPHSNRSLSPLDLAQTNMVRELTASPGPTHLPSPAPLSAPLDSSPRSATCWDLDLASCMPAITITPPDVAITESQVEGDNMIVD